MPQGWCAKYVGGMGLKMSMSLRVAATFFSLSAMSAARV